MGLMLLIVFVLVPLAIFYIARSAMKTTKEIKQAQVGPIDQKAKKQTIINIVGRIVVIAVIVIPFLVWYINVRISIGY